MRKLAIAALFLVGCSDPPPPPPKKAPPPRPAASASAGAAPAAPAPMVRGNVLEDARKRTLSKDDFTESDSNRDPFRTFLSSFATKMTVNLAHKIVFEKFALDELKLAGIVTGELQPRAMFIDPTGQGVAIVRGDHISKVDALVTRVAADRVYVRIEEDAGQEKPRVIERTIELHAGELTSQ